MISQFKQFGFSVSLITKLYLSTHLVENPPFFPQNGTSVSNVKIDPYWVIWFSPKDIS